MSHPNCCDSSDYKRGWIDHDGEAVTVPWECDNCGNEYTQRYALKTVEREDGKRFSPNRASYPCSDDCTASITQFEFEVVEADVIKTSAKCSKCGTNWQDIFETPG